MILNTALNLPIERKSTEGMEFKEIREKTLYNLKEASDIFNTISTSDNFEEFLTLPAYKLI